MRLSETEFRAYLLDGIGEIGLELTSYQIRQFFFICGSYKSGIAASILPVVMMTYR